ncbi:membrane-bound lytic murein transglycosylase A [Candidatus Endolissoclinum faulkneri L5]|uniref:peptidoglycan lytic exotransglycosylase n=1 Tax=Candidatus Endolissoclinum faulkneri L5 TaxID=1401328 RepID=V9TXG2_9PROT|nr:MltA domain-containing protein [Candidatus Endolissoclinum faulkneri]AHC74015.1 membrane-bound lytic murein transglycosylase A [Candidatus Endolissoclinum faulkneri L5]
MFLKKNKQILVLIAVSLLLNILITCSVNNFSTAEEGKTLLLSRYNFANLSGWLEDNVDAAMPAVLSSCSRMLENDDDKYISAALPRFGTVGDWRKACTALEDRFRANSTAATARAVFEEYFAVWRASDEIASDGIFTGYYEPQVRGARRYDATKYTVPLYPCPDDLITLNLGDFRKNMKGGRIAGRVGGLQMKLYDSRADIEGGSLKDKVKPIFYLADPIEAFFLHIQGSGLIILPDGSSTRVAYDGQNGHLYFPIGRYLIKKGYLKHDDISMQTIHTWLKNHPKQMYSVMNLNPSYIFFHEISGEGPIGAQGVVLTAGRSLAVDRTKHALGVPIWVDIDYDYYPKGIKRLTVAQDTGGAIRGPIRGDFFWGSGKSAGEMAGSMKARGRMWLLLPLSVNPNYMH